MNSLVTAEIRLDALRGNIAAIRRRVARGTELCPAVKANAYGHGLELVLPVLTKAGTGRVSVANLIEAVELRRLGWLRPILCLAPMLAEADEKERRERAEQAVLAQASVTVMSTDEARELSATAVRLHKPARVEIKVDTGMGRMGLLPEAAATTISEVAALPGIIIDGVYTHLASADEPDLEFSHLQLRTFLALRDRLIAHGVSVYQYHIANSSAVFRMPKTHLDRVRPGLCLYGYWDGPPDERPPDIRPCMRVISRLTAVRRLPPDHAVGYGRTFITQRESRIGIVPIGYGDGYRRRLGNNAIMTLEPVRARGRSHVQVVGRISMDQTTIDLTEAGDVRIGDPVTIIDDDPAAPNCVEALARRLGTIPYEITCLIGPRVQRKSI
ncbi:MAG TPA: alanine racemase [Phycisphaerae bacterium]|nr:alanine racemase [Phycisphaerae bacterium]